jgi:glyoxylase-like metal-dependent hydrolase (beta-lactamase superfamily II)/ferredoxin
MASPAKRLPNNVAGDFFVDSTCINCDTCRQYAPGTFADDGEYSFVKVQPEAPDDRRLAFRALLACPTASIGTQGFNETSTVIEDFPLEIEDGVFACGFNSPKSYGGHSYFITHPEGNWLVDSPRYVQHLVKKFEELGGISKIFLTHRDDVAEAAAYARHFKAERLIHIDERSAQPDAEHFFEGFEPIPVGKDFLIVPTPGHTKGHCVLLYRGKFLFSGDHLWWSRERNGLSASRDFCWYSFPEQMKSFSKLKDFGFEWVLPGHGEKGYLGTGQSTSRLDELIARFS